MDAKLTLKLNQEIIEQAKKYATEKKISLSRLIENYLQSITHKPTEDSSTISPFVKSLTSGVQIPTDLDYKKEFHDYLKEKYK